MIPGTTLREVRLRLGMDPQDVARRADCPVETVVRGEFGTLVPTDPELQRRLAAAYGLSLDDYLALAGDAADRWSSGGAAGPPR